MRIWWHRNNRRGSRGWYRRAGVVLVVGALGLVLAAGIVWAINQEVKTRYQEHVFTSVDDLPHAQAVMVLGARVYGSGALSAILEDRAATALQVYESGLADKILVSGDHGRKEYDEVNAVKVYLLDRGVPESDIFLDHAGFDTYDSMYRAREVFAAESLIVSTQNFHLPRAVYIARRLGIEAYGVSADRHEYLAAGRNSMREALARVKAVIDLIVHARPRFLGNAIPITSDGRQSWD